MDIGIKNKKHLTEQEKKEYLKKFDICPYCGSDDITVDYMEVDGHSARQKITCYDCDKQWKDVYELCDIEEIE